MNTPPRGRAVGDGELTPKITPRKALQKGLFQDGIWHCDCNPRLPAAHFQVKKDGPNKSRWFYTCQESKDSGCRFFCWDDDAVGREMRAVLGNTRSEVSELKTPAEASRGRLTVEGHKAASNKFMADLAKADKDEYGGWSLLPEEERRLVQAVEEQVALHEPARAVIKVEHHTTPGMKRKREHDAPPIWTPAGTNAGFESVEIGWDLNRTPSSRPDKVRNRFGLRSPSNTPTPSLYRDALDTSEEFVKKVRESYDIGGEVMELLEGQKIDGEVLESLEKLFGQQALRMSGIAKGRDITRLALKSKETKIAELQQKITALETEREMDKTIIRHFKSDMAHSVEGRRGRGTRRT